MSDEVTELPMFTQDDYGVVEGDDRFMVTVSMTTVDGVTCSTSVHAPEPETGGDELVAKLAVQALLGAAEAFGPRVRAAVGRQLVAYSGEL